jgi:hypothetical protein
LRYVKDPDTGRRISRLNSQSEWVIVDVPELRIVLDEAWQAVKVRQQQMQQVIGVGGNPRRAVRPIFLLSGLIRCGTCRSTYVKCGTHRLACSGRRERGICTNALTITMEEIEERVLSALQSKFFECGRFEAFCEEFTSAVNQARMEHSANVSSAKRELVQLELRRKKLIECILQGIPGAEVKDEMIAMAARREDIKGMLEATPPPPPLLHPDMATLWREQITELRDALADNRCDPEAREAVRQMVEEIRLSPREGVLAVDVKGNLAAMLSAGSPGEDWQRQLTLVAGACNRRYLLLWRGAA